MTYTGPTTATRNATLPASFTVLLANGRAAAGAFSGDNASYAVGRWLGRGGGVDADLLHAPRVGFEASRLIYGS